MNKITPEFEMYADEIAHCIIKNLNKPKHSTNAIELHRRIHNHEEQTEINLNCRNGWDDEPTGLI